MKNNGDVAHDWLKKADSDFEAVQISLDTNKALDAASFHCQQAAERALKAWLTLHNIEFPSTHDLEELIRLCQPVEPRFTELLVDAAALTPYAVRLRYTLDFWPSTDQVRTALEQARRIYQFVRDHWS